MDRIWHALELAADGDAEAAIDELANDDTEIKYIDRVDETLIFRGVRVDQRETEDHLESIVEHLNRAVAVINSEGGGGSIIGLYYECETDSVELVEKLSQHPRWTVEPYFDYFSTKYGIHAAV